MKKRIGISLICLLMAFQLFAAKKYTTFKERTETWLERSSEERSSGQQRVGPPTIPDPTVGGFQDAIPFIVFLSGTYLFLLYRKKGKAIQE
jgi:hypothetical protein